jgi:hypothetical protein
MIRLLWSDGGARAREHALVSALFVISRAILHRAGMRLNFILDWMHQSDPEDLRTRLFETLYYSHAYPPGMNLLTGLVLKTSEAHASAVAYAMLYAFGLVLVNSLYYLYRVSGFSEGAALGITVAFSLLPQMIYFEHLYLYTYPTAALLCLAAALFHRAVLRRSFEDGRRSCGGLGDRHTEHVPPGLVRRHVGARRRFTARADRGRVLLSAIGPASPSSRST